jgi:hypothetical protein
MFSSPHLSEWSCTIYTSGVTPCMPGLNSTNPEEHRGTHTHTHTLFIMIENAHRERFAAKYKGRPTAEDAYHKGVDCQKHSFLLASARKQESYAVKECNIEASKLFSEYARWDGNWDGNIVPDTDGRFQSGFMCKSWLHIAKENMQSSLRFACPWEASQMNDLGKTDEVISMVRCLVEAWHRSLPFGQDKAQEPFVDVIRNGDHVIQPDRAVEDSGFARYLKFVHGGMAALVGVSILDAS